MMSALGMFLKWNLRRQVDNVQIIKVQVGMSHKQIHIELI